MESRFGQKTDPADRPCLPDCSGCLFYTEVPEQVERPAGELYDEALDLAMDGNAKKAAPIFEEVERQHPYSDLAVRHRSWPPGHSIRTMTIPRRLHRWTGSSELNPADPLVEYAYYLKALSYYEQIVDVERDAEMTLLALNAFDDLLRRFPEGTYSRDARLKADLARSHLAGKEMAVARFYAQNGHYTAAIRRFKSCD